MSIIDAVVIIVCVICLTFLGVCYIYQDYFKGDDK